MLKCTFCLFIPKDKTWKNQQQNNWFSLTRQENAKPKNTVMEEYFNISFQRYSCFFPLILDIHTLKSLACEEALLGFPGVRGSFSPCCQSALGELVRRLWFHWFLLYYCNLISYCHTKTQAFFSRCLCIQTNVILILNLPLKAMIS